MLRLIKNLFNYYGIEIKRFAKGENNFEWLYSDSINTIIDIGAHIGKYSIIQRKKYPNAIIYAFEPLHDAYFQLISHFEDDPNFFAKNVALGNENKTIDFIKSSRKSSSSVLHLAGSHKSAFPDSAIETTQKIEMMRLDDYFINSERQIKKDLIIKIDVQGYEYEVILGGTRTIKQAKALICEVSFEKLYINQKLFKDVLDLLTDYGFQFIGIIDQIYHPDNGAVLQANAVFGKKHK